MRLILPLVCALAAPAAAQDIYADLPLTCSGAALDWSMTLTEDGTLFDFHTTSELDIAWVTYAEGAVWPVALTLIGRGDSAIVILEAAQDDTHAVRVLTQRGETPHLLLGTCDRP